MKSIITISVVILGLIILGVYFFFPEKSEPNLNGDVIESVIPIDRTAEVKVAYTDDNTGETFIIKSDQEFYGGKEFEVILGVTNLRDGEWGTLKLKSVKEKIVSVSKYVSVASTIDIPIYSDKETKCPPESASSTCYIKIQTGTTTKEVVLDTWEKITLTEGTIKTSLLQKETLGVYDDNEVRYFFPKGTTFLKLTLSSPNLKDEFYIEIFGENGGYGMLDPGVETLLDSYNPTKNSSFLLASNNIQAGGETFTTPNDGVTYSLSSAKFYLLKDGTPTGSFSAELYALTGTPGTNAVPTGSVLATSDGVNVSVLDTTYTLITFTFSGVNQYAMSPNTNYGIDVYYVNTAEPNYVAVGTDNTLSDDGNDYRTTDNKTSWQAQARNVAFYVYGLGPSVGGVDEDIILFE
jgi:hypothetical protein